MTILEWLNTIQDEDIREKAISNYNSKDCDGEGAYENAHLYSPESLSAAIRSAFIWPASPEGFDFWNNRADILF